MENIIKKSKAILFDLDGTLYLGDTLIGDVKNTLSALRQNGKTIVYLTNNSSRGTDTYVEKLKNIGFYKEGDLVYSSGLAAVEYLHRYYPGKKVKILLSHLILSKSETSRLSMHAS